ncbi:hypothetical protein NpPPO83_00006566 [Neofusicoccum parvum]|uniref:Uncharacterized protein n=1 Tax=Neofusicoccum parvum TaxID=310453 RepID=A0ACB5SPJ5_9PEZI|nr:hypothetical protein NpPPO83_00006566 [Neofusicoccum parvum]
MLQLPTLSEPTQQQPDNNNIVTGNSVNSPSLSSLMQRQYIVAAWICDIQDACANTQTPSVVERPRKRPQCINANPATPPPSSSGAPAKRLSALSSRTGMLLDLGDENYSVDDTRDDFNLRYELEDIRKIERCS